MESPASNDHNGTKALAHGSKNKFFCLSQHVASCKGQSTAEEVKLFSDLYERSDCATIKKAPLANALARWGGRECLRACIDVDVVT